MGQLSLLLPYICFQQNSLQKQLLYGYVLIQFSHCIPQVCMKCNLAFLYLFCRPLEKLAFIICDLHMHQFFFFLRICRNCCTISTLAVKGSLYSITCYLGMMSIGSHVTICCSLILNSELIYFLRLMSKDISGGQEDACIPATI